MGLGHIRDSGFGQNNFRDEGVILPFFCGQWSFSNFDEKMIICTINRSQMIRKPHDHETWQF